MADGEPRGIAVDPIVMARCEASGSAGWTPKAEPHRMFAEVLRASSVWTGAEDGGRWAERATRGRRGFTVLKDSLIAERRSCMVTLPREMWMIPTVCAPVVNPFE